MTQEQEKNLKYLLNIKGCTRQQSWIEKELKDIDEQIEMFAKRKAELQEDLKKLDNVDERLNALILEIAGANNPKPYTGLEEVKMCTRNPDYTCDNNCTHWCKLK